MNATLEKIREDIRHNEVMRKHQDAMRKYEIWKIMFIAVAAVAAVAGAFAAGAAWVRFFG